MTGGARAGSLSLARLVWAGITRLRGRYVLLALVLALSSAVTVFGSSLGSYAAAQSAGDAASTAQLRVVTVYPTTTKITDSSIEAMRSVPHVQGAIPFIRVLAGIRATGGDVSLIGVEPSTAPPVLVSGAYGFGGSNQRWVVLPATADGQDYRDRVGSSIDLTVTVALDGESGSTKEVPFSVTGVSDPSYQVDAVNAAYVPLDVARELYLQRMGVKDGDIEAAGGYEKATVVVDDQQAVPGVVDALQQQGFQAVSRMQELSAVPGVINLIRVAAAFVGGALFLICLITTGLMSLAMTRQRTRELGVLRASGWSGRRVLGAWTAEIAIVAVIAVVVGAVLGLVLALAFGGTVRTQLGGGQLGAMVLDPLGLGLPVLVLFALACLVAALTIRSASRRDIATLMRSLV